MITEADIEHAFARLFHKWRDQVRRGINPFADVEATLTEVRAVMAQLRAQARASSDNQSEQR